MGETFGNGGGTQVCDGGGAGREGGCSNTGERPTICVSIIARNEDANIIRALESARPLATRWCVMDTGSTDKTLEVLHNYAAENADTYPGKICQGPFQDFSQARNLLYEHAKDQAEWLLLMDADHVWDDPQRILPYLREDLDGISFPSAESCKYWSIRLIRTGLPWKYTGRTHEILHPATSRVVRIPIPIRHIGDGGHKENKYSRDLELLRLDVADYPDNSYYQYRLATTLQALGRYEEALPILQKTIDLCKDQAEEKSEIRYWAEIGYGISLEEMGKRGEAEAFWLRAAYMRTQRREALLMLLVSLNSRRAYRTTCQVAQVFAQMEDVAAIERRGGEVEDIFHVFPDAWVAARIEWAGAAALSGRIPQAQKLLATLQSEGIPVSLQASWDRVTEICNKSA